MKTQCYWHLKDEQILSLIFSGSNKCPEAECLFHRRGLGLHKMDNQPTDSDGNLCGEGVNAGRPYGHFFDLALCAGLNSTSQPCPSVQVDFFLEKNLRRDNI